MYIQCRYQFCFQRVFTEMTKKCFAALERSLVPWIADSEVKFCPICKKPFNVARRRHHCRLCGGIMCAKCSTFVSVSFSSKSCV